MDRMRIVSVCVMACLAVTLCGCQTAKGPTDEELIGKLTQECMAAAKAKDIDKVLSFYSDNFAPCQVGDKNGLKEFLNNAKASGYLDGLEIDLSNAKTVVKGNIATVAPVILRGGFGSTSIAFTSTKEKAGWKITAMDIEM